VGCFACQNSQYFAGHSTIPSTKLSGNNHQIVKLASNIFVVRKMLKLYILDIQYGNFLADFTSQGVLNKDPSVWLDGARPVNTCIPTSFPCTAAWCTNQQKYIFKYKRVQS
jgi:hypothetical protein